MKPSLATNLNIRASVFQLVNAIREYCASQRDTWRTIPRLALDADGRLGFSDQRAVAFGSKLWQLYILGQPQPIGWVCLETGNIVALYNSATLAAAEDVIKLAHHLDLINAGAIALDLRQIGKAKVARGIAPRSAREITRLRCRLLQPAIRGPIDIGID